MGYREGLAIADTRRAAKIVTLPWEREAVQHRLPPALESRMAYNFGANQ